MIHVGRGTRWGSALLGATLSVTAFPARAATVPRPATLSRLAEGPAPELSAPQRRELDELIAAAEFAAASTNEDPEMGRDPLRRALNKLAARPGLTARDEKAHRVRVDGLLTLARAELALDEEADAITALDEAIRIARGETVPAEAYGPSLMKLHNLRVGAPELAPDGSVHVECPTACRVIVDGREAGLGTDVLIAGVPLGTHRVRIEPSFEVDGRGFEESFTLSASGKEQSFAYDPPPAPKGEGGAPGQPGQADPGGGDASGYHRRLPRWAGILGIVVGAAAVAGGATLLAVDGTCPDGTDPTGPDACENTLNTLAIGAAVTAIGGASLIGFSVALGIGEVRQKRHKAGDSASVGLRLRF